jgi:hypothetical protein
MWLEIARGGLNRLVHFVSTRVLECRFPGMSPIRMTSDNIDFSSTLMYNMNMGITGGRVAVLVDKEMNISIPIHDGEEFIETISNMKFAHNLLLPSGKEFIKKFITIHRVTPFQGSTFSQSRRQKNFHRVHTEQE